MFLNADNVDAERMSSGRLLEATGPTTENVRLPSCSLFLGTTKSPRAAERRAERLGTVEAGMNITIRYHGARPWIVWYTSRQTVNKMRSLARSQCEQCVSTLLTNCFQRTGTSSEHYTAPV